MTLKIDATYENGVFVPAQRPALADHERVRLIVETVESQSGAASTVRSRAERRIRIDPQLAREIGSSAEFHPDNQ